MLKIICAIAALKLSALSAQAAPDTSTNRAVETPAQLAGKRLLFFGWGLNYIAVIRPDGTADWRIPASDTQIDGWWTKEKTLIYLFSRGVREVRRNPAATIWAVS